MEIGRDKKFREDPGGCSNIGDYDRDWWNCIIVVAKS